MLNVNSLKEGYSPVIVHKPSEQQKVTLESPIPTKKNNFIIPTMLGTLLVPTTAFASETNDTFLSIYNAVMNLFDGGVVLVIIFAGASWMLGHRSKAIEQMIGVACGYLLASHAIDIRDFLKTI